MTHTNVPPQVAMNLVAEINQSRGKGAALFQKRKARSEKWVIDENNVKKQGYQPTSNYIGVCIHNINLNYFIIILIISIGYNETMGSTCTIMF